MTVERRHIGQRMSQIVIHGDTVYLAGQVADVSESTSAADQTRSILSKIDKLLAEAGSDKGKILSATIWLSDIRDYDEINEVWDAWVPEGEAPARACIEAKLAAQKFIVEIGIIAAR
ncbi:MAG: RidA family protein [Pseudomonadota bacterium]